MAIDVLSDVLRVIRLDGSLFLNAEFREPWCVAAPSTKDLAPVLNALHEDMAICHLVVEGRCWARLGGGAPVPLEPGDVLVLPRGEAHLLGSGLHHGPLSVGDAVELKVPDMAGMRYGGSGERTILICGWFAYDRRVAGPIIDALPGQFHTNIRRRRSGAWLETAMRYAAEEAASRRPGAVAVADKLAEALFVEALRGFVDSQPAAQAGWIAGLRDALVGRALALMHERPAHPWTVTTLAQAASTSRTVLAERFAALLGMPPMQYLTQWRVALAAHLLRHGRLSLTRIAEEIGYRSEAAFSRAFKRQYGKSPGAWRRRSGLLERAEG